MSNSQSTTSLCPVCLQRVEARRVQRGEQVFLEKRCERHGAFATRIWDGQPALSTWKRPKTPARAVSHRRPVTHGCPFDCGLCRSHRQRTCTVLLEVTARCNLACPVCFADAGRAPAADPSLQQIQAWIAAAGEQAAGSNVQLSGGEPTLRDDLPEMVRMVRRAGFNFVQVNTNGLRLAEDGPYVAALQAAGLDSVFLQFDGTDDAIFEKLRGRPLLAEKRAAIEACGKHGIGVVLVPTLVPGINDHDVGRILELAIEQSPVVRAVHFQPVSYFGRSLRTPADEGRITLPQLMRSIENQSQGRFKVADFRPPGCEHAQCSFSASYLVLPDRSLQHLNGAGPNRCCPAPIPAEEGAAQSMAFVASQWGAPKPCCPPETARGLTGEGTGPEMMDLDAFLQRSRTHRLNVSAMAFQDVWNLDLDRVQACCIHVMAPDGRLVPFCLYNLTSSSGERLYRQ